MPALGVRYLCSSRRDVSASGQPTVTRGAETLPGYRGGPLNHFHISARFYDKTCQVFAVFIPVRGVGVIRNDRSLAATIVQE